ncbi:MAG: DUF192 domain-containing protein [Cyanobacteriota bacterium]
MSRRQRIGGRPPFLQRLSRPPLPLAWLLGGVWLLGACGADGSEQGPPQQLPIEAQWCLGEGGTKPCIELEVPKTPRQYNMGLQLRPALPPLRGMWFSFTPPTPARFWMHRTLAPLDLIFFANNRVVAIEANAPVCPNLPCPNYGPAEPVDGVVELGAGEAQRLGLKVGSPVGIQWLPLPAKP